MHNGFHATSISQQLLRNTGNNRCRWQCQQWQQFSRVKLGILVAYVATKHTSADRRDTNVIRMALWQLLSHKEEYNLVHEAWSTIRCNGIFSVFCFEETVVTVDNSKILKGTCTSCTTQNIPKRFADLPNDLCEGWSRSDPHRIRVRNPCQLLADCVGADFINTHTW